MEKCGTVLGLLVVETALILRQLGSIMSSGNLHYEPIMQENGSITHQNTFLFSKGGKLYLPQKPFSLVVRGPKYNGRVGPLAVIFGIFTRM